MITAEQIHNELWDLGLNRLADPKGIDFSKWARMNYLEIIKD